MLRYLNGTIIAFAATWGKGRNVKIEEEDLK